jgi:uncharacterized protein
MSKWSAMTSLRILVSEDDTHDGRPLHEAIILAARNAHLAGANVTRGITGYGRSRHVHEVWRGFSYDLPVIVEIIDTDDNIEAWLPVLERLRDGVLVTRHRVEVLEPIGVSKSPTG